MGLRQYRQEMELVPKQETVLGERRVLIVEDDQSLRPLWEKVLQNKDVPIKVDWATTLDEAERLVA